MLATIKRIPISLGNVAVSMVVGHIALVYVGIFYPERLRGMLKVAKVVKEWIVEAGIPPRYNIWVDLLLEEKSLLFMFFTVMARFVLSILTEGVVSLWRRARM
jgi:hypothetical protein